MTTPIARFQVNGIEIGSLPRTVYDDIQRAVRRDPALYYAYCINVTGALLRALYFCIRMVPLLLFLALAFLVMLDPDSFTSMVGALRAAEPAEVTHAARATLLCVTAAVMVIVLIVSLIKPSNLAIRDPFSEAVSHNVRRLLEVPTEGPLTVEFDDGAQHQRG